MPTIIEVLHNGEWKAFIRQEPGAQPGSMSDSSSGRRELISFRCADDDSRTIIEQAEGGVDYEEGKERLVITTGLRALKEVYPGESHEMVVLTDVSKGPHRIRVRHVRNEQ